MPLMPQVHRVRGQLAPEKRTYRDENRRRGTRTEQGYSNRWLRARAVYLAEHPLCVMCTAAGRTVPANVVDHRIPHRGDDDLFWDESNWQPLCAPCHNGPKRRAEQLELRLQRARESGGSALRVGGSKSRGLAQPEARPVAKKCAREKAENNLDRI
jgi:5-methylcytosine-specific restriction enzyme A